MDARELRIGNIVKWADDNNAPFMELSISGVFNGGDVWVEWVWYDGQKDDADCAIEELAPIPLTEEWLTRFGFERQGLNRFWNDPVLLIFYVDCCVYLVNQRHVNIYYVHQLQNLYFALTGAELELKDDAKEN